MDGCSYEDGVMVVFLDTYDGGIFPLVAAHLASRFLMV